MAATEKGVWDLQQVRDKQLQSEWIYDSYAGGYQYVWGENEGNGALGLNNDNDSNVTILGTSSEWHKGGITSGGYFNIATKMDGTLWTWGFSSQGQLGHNQGGSVKISSPTQVGTDSNWTRIPEDEEMIACNNKIANAPNQMYAIKGEGELWACGANGDGDLGLNNKTTYSSPVQIGTETTWRRITKGYPGATLGIKTDGTLWAWGGQTFGALGLNDAVGRSSPHQVGTDTNWKYTSCGGANFSMGIKTDNTMWVWGYGGGGALGVGNKTDYSSPKQLPGSWKMVCCSDQATSAIKTDGTLWAWGVDNNAGQLGLNSYPAQYSSPKQIGTDTTWKDTVMKAEACFGLKTDGTWWAWGRASGDVGGNQFPTGGRRSSPVQQPGTDWQYFSCMNRKTNGAINSGTI